MSILFQMLGGIHWAITYPSFELGQEQFKIANGHLDLHALTDLNLADLVGNY